MGAQKKRTMGAYMVLGMQGCVDVFAMSFWEADAVPAVIVAWQPQRPFPHQHQDDPFR
jgi:hypothetical protein